MEQRDQSLMHTWVTTTWPKIIDGAGEGSTALQARKDLLVRYHEAVYHYFLSKIRDSHDAGELYTNFALRLMESPNLIKNADPEKGRFRNYLKTALHHMVVDYFRKKKREKRFQPLALDVAQHDITAEESGNPENDFPPIWRQELLNQAWKALEKLEKRSGQLHYTVLRFQSDHADLKTPQLTERFNAQFGKNFTADNMRQSVHRAREKFAAFLLEEVEHSLENPTREQLEEELIDLQLLVYCKRALEKRQLDQV
jgi:RNA polymerase sigma-70 factor (ECF subfamily)